tara:strand:- start:1849 stop:2118 length:270 start_codon:yes stop_codon:yes gene_type:complete
MDISIIELYNSYLKMGIRILRTPDRKFKYSKQITPLRNIWVDTIYEDLDEFKGEILSEIINGYKITHNQLGLDFIDTIMKPIEDSKKID